MLILKSKKPYFIFVSKKICDKVVPIENVGWNNTRHSTRRYEYSKWFGHEDYAISEGQVQNKNITNAESDGYQTLVIRMRMNTIDGVLKKNNGF